MVAAAAAATAMGKSQRSSKNSVCSYSDSIFSRSTSGSSFTRLSDLSDSNIGSVGARNCRESGCKRGCGGSPWWR